jgi:hypothetical protein
MSIETQEPLIFRRSLWAGCLLVLVLVASGLLKVEPQLLGTSGAEIFGHAWVQWWHAEALPTWPSGTEWALGASNWPVVDPLPTALAAILSKAVGLGWAWNTLLLFSVALCFWGGAFLSHRAGGVALLGGLGCALSPVFLGSLASGLTEDASLGLLAFALGFLLFPRGRRDRLWGGILLGLTAWCGLYLAFMGALLALVCGLGSVWRTQQARGVVLREWALAGCIALGIAGLALVLIGGRLGGEGHRFGSPPLPQFEPLWQLNPVRSADVASFFAPGRPLVPEDTLIRMHPVYFGWVLVLCAFRAGKSAWWWVVASTFLIACGPVFHWAGRSTEFGNPVDWAFSWLPFAEQINHKARLMLVGQMALVVLAAKGLQKWKSPAHWVCLAWVLEVFFLSPAPLPLPTTPAQVDAIFYEAAQGTGTLLVIPVGGPGIHPQRPLYEQRAHARVLALRPNRPGPLPGMAQNPTGRWLFSLGQPHALEAPNSIDVGPFLEQGVQSILVREAWVDSVSKGLGDPTVRGQGGAIWELSGLN